MAASKIAILQTAFLGDTLLAIPLAKNLREKHQLALICRSGFADFFRATRLFEIVIEIEKGDRHSYRRARAEIEKWWADADSRWLVSSHESPRSKMFALRMRMGNATATIGYDDRGFVRGPSLAAYSSRVKRPMGLPEAIRQLALLQSDAFADSKAWRERISEFSLRQELPGGRDRAGGLVSVPDWASMRVDAFVSESREKMAVLAPGSVWKTKQWTREGFVAVGRKLVASGRRVTVIGTENEAELCHGIAGEIGSGAKSTAGETSLVETALTISKAEIAVVNDSGAMHLAAVTDTPVVAVFGPTVLDFGYRPWTNRARAIEPAGQLACRPCGLHGSQICPIGTHVCMTGTTANRVWSEVSSLINL